MKQQLLYVSLAALVLTSAPQNVGSAEPGETALVHPTREAELRYHLAQNLLDADWVRVAKLETGARLNSNVSRKAHNYFGLHRSGKRPTTAVGRYRQYAKYNSLAECVADVRHWVDMSPRKDGESFDRFLKRRGWNHLPTYWRALRKMKA